MQEPKAEADGPAPLKRGRGGRPRNKPGTVRDVTIGVRVAPAEYIALKTKADTMSVTPGQWLRQAALARRLPAPPVPAINREEYASLARLAANLNQLAKAANEGRSVTVADALLQQLTGEVRRLRLALLGTDRSE
jgi:hypothetical protein